MVYYKVKCNYRVADGADMTGAAFSEMKDAEKDDDNKRGES